MPQTPVALRSTQWHQFAPPGPLTSKLKSKLAREAGELFERWQQAANYVQRIAQEHVELEQKLASARSDLERAQGREISSLGKDRALPAAERLAGVEVEMKSRSTNGKSLGEQAREQAAGAREVYAQFVGSHWRALVEEHRGFAEKISAPYAEALQTFREATDGLLDQHDELCQSLRHVIGATEPFGNADLPRTSRESSGYERLAFPSADALERRAQWEVGEAERRRQYEEKLASDEAERLREEAEDEATGRRRYRPLVRPIAA